MCVVVRWFPFAINCRLLCAQKFRRVFLALDLRLFVHREFAHWLLTLLNLDLLVGSGLADLFMRLLNGHFVVFWEDEELLKCSFAWQTSQAVCRGSVISAFYGT